MGEDHHCGGTGAGSYSLGQGIQEAIDRAYQAVAKIHWKGPITERYRLPRSPKIIGDRLGWIQPKTGEDGRGKNS